MFITLNPVIAQVTLQHMCKIWGILKIYFLVLFYAEFYSYRHFKVLSKRKEKQNYGKQFFFVALKNKLVRLSLF